MSKASSVYIAFAAIFVGGLWLILSIGARLAAVPDVSGAWTLESDQKPVETLSIEQSGLFLRISRSGRPFVSSKLRSAGDDLLLIDTPEYQLKTGPPSEDESRPVIETRAGTQSQYIARPAPSPTSQPSHEH